MHTVSVHEAKTHLSRLLKRVAAGEEILITNRGEPVGTLTAPQKPKRRPPGALAHLAHEFHIPDDFDDPMPEEWFGADNKFDNDFPTPPKDGSA